MNENIQEDVCIRIGLDEAGRGPLFGRVYASAVIISEFNPEIKDSKKLTEKKIKLLADYIKTHAIAYAVEYATEQEIDEINILQATMLAMHRCIESITKLISGVTPQYMLYIDGTYFKKYKNMKHICIPQGDSLYYEISCASILAKNARDSYISELCDAVPRLILYDIRSNKGYGAKKHIDAIKIHGITEYHRKTFRQCAGMPMIKTKLTIKQK